MSVDFGTSGLRAPAIAFTPEICHAHVAAFLRTACAGAGGRSVFLGADLRASSPEIAGHCVAAVVAEGREPVWAGNVPTPALAAHALARRAPAIMITGSHIPEDFNGIKFYRPDGEFLKEDEAPVRAAAATLLAEARAIAPVGLPTVDPTIATDYVERYAAAFPGAPLAGLRIGVDLHSAVGRDLTVAILTRLGADVVPFRRADRFVAVDTEAVDPGDLARDREMLATHGLDAVVSTDGDGDRPLVIDETGRQINGDVLGTLTARFLGIDVLVTPLTSTTGIELSGWFSRVIRTRIGSPHVVAGMAAVAGEGRVAGFEANGGFLLETDLTIDGHRLARLPTRDAILPIVGGLLAARRVGTGLAALAATLPARVMKADRLKRIPHEVGGAFLAAMATSREARAEVDPRIADPVAVDTVDGVRLTLPDRSIVHFRQSGNAPELRCYVETETAEATERLLGDLLAAMAARVRGADAHG